MDASRPRFSVIFDADTCANDLEFPAYIQLALPEMVFLRDKCDNRWEVEARKVGGYLYFLDGWEKFVKDNFLTTDDLLRFRCTSKELFDVKIFGPLGCEKDGARRREGNEVTPNVIPGNPEKPRRKRRKIDWRGRGIFGEDFPKPDGVYFVTRFGAKRKNELYIPKGLMTMKGFIVPSKVKLVDPRGHIFTTRFRQWQDARSFYIGGWSQLLKENGITKDDICICEFDKKVKPKYIFVSFLRKS